MSEVNVAVARVLSGWTWIVSVDDETVIETKPLAKEDLEGALYEIQRGTDRANRLFDSASDAEVFFLLYAFFFGGLSDALEVSANEQGWAKHLVSPPVPTVCASHMFLVSGHETRLLVGDGGRLTRAVRTRSFDDLLGKCRLQLSEA
jgi:hypothetical protein